MAREICEDKSRSFVYSDDSSTNPTISTHLVNQIQGFDSNPEIFNLTTSMEMIGFSKNHHHHQPGDATSSAHLWRTFFNKPGNNASSSKPTTSINESTSDFYQNEFNTSGENLLVGHDSAPWQDNRQQLLVDDSSLRCVFPCEGNERPSQGLSLSLSSTNPTSIGLQSFELRQTSQNNHDQGDDMRFMGSSCFFNKSANIQQLIHHQGQFQLRSSKYLGPAQELLNEFCSLASSKQTDVSKPKINKSKQWDDEGSSTCSRKQALHSLEFFELQKRKTKLLSMLEEVCVFSAFSSCFLGNSKDPSFFPFFTTKV